jgi:glycosyltransferase involved in cell wall biosynthesis
MNTYLNKNEISKSIDLPVLILVTPCYNEEEVLQETSKRLISILDELIKEKKISKNSCMIFVDDGSRDKTWDNIEYLSNKTKYIKGIKLSKNVGHQIALIAGMEYAVDKCDCLITLDVDLQDDVEAIKSMIVEYNSGYEVVYGVRSKREKDVFFKKFSAEMFYHVMKLLGVNIIFNHADYRLLSKRATMFLLSFQERNIFIRGLVPLIGLRSTSVYYERNERYSGESKYSLYKMLNFALDGITSFSIFPLRFISMIGFITFLTSILMIFYVFFVKFFTNKALPGWASTVLPIYFIGGIQLLSLGIIGEYLGKIYKETKRRPRYFIEKEALYEKD